MSQENQNAKKYTLRAGSQYSVQPSVVLRVVDYTPDNVETPTQYTHKFINPWLPLAIIGYNQADYPIPGVIGKSPVNPPITITEVEPENGFYAWELFGTGLQEKIADFPTLINFFGIIKEDSADLDYIAALASRLPEECWFAPEQIAVNYEDFVNTIFNINYRILILEKR